jgi:beta-glucanase (GH16 family)
MISNTPLASANSSTPKVRIVARLKVPSGYGLTAVFNGFGSAAWPTGGEIDYVEIQSDDTREYGTDYQYGTQADVNLVSGGFLFNPTTADLSLCYHVYMMEWTQNSLNSYLDGKLVETKTAGGHVPDLFGKSHSLSFSLPVGGGNYGSSLNTANIKTGTLYVDYVKVFTSN